MTVSARPQQAPASGAGGAVPRARQYQGLQLFANSFRPFFLFGAVYAWVAAFAGFALAYGPLLLGRRRA